jgi:glycosyltransferase involved in cell wall biosynthesis
LLLYLKKTDHLKYLILISTDDFLGGAQIRYLSIFREISNQNNDYFLVINNKFYRIAKEKNLLPVNEDHIKIFDLKQTQILNNQDKRNSQKKITKRTKAIFVRRLANIFLDFLRYLRYVELLQSVFRANPPSYVYSVWAGGMFSWPLKYMYRFKFVYSYMDSGFSSLNHFLSGPLKSERLALKHADIIDFLSEDLFKKVEKRVKLNRKTKISVSPCTFKDFSRFIPAKTKENMVVFCSRLTPIKNPLLFLESISHFNKLAKENISTLFVLLGDGSLMQAVIDFKQKGCLNNLLIAGEVSNPEEFLSRSLIFVSIQTNNNYPSQSLLEAMACENAVVASNVGETDKLISGEEGILVNLDPIEIGDAIHRLISDTDLCKRMGEKARLKVLADHNPKKYIDYFYSLENR